jgi:hypothetical protein
MTARITEIRDALNDLIEATVPDYKRLPDFDIADNPNIMIQKGYRVAYSPAQNASNEWCNDTVQRIRTMTFAMTNQWVVTNDSSSAEAYEDALITDQDAVVKAIVASPVLNPGTDIVTTYVSDNGLEYLLDSEEKKQYVLIVTTITVNYFERVST